MTLTDGRTVEISYHPTKTGGFVVTRSDITERVQAEDMARDREALLTTILDTNPTPVVMARLDDSRIVYRSPAAVDVFGDIDFALDAYVEAEGREKYTARLKKTGRAHDAQLQMRRADGSVMQVSLSGGLTEYNGATHVVSSITDLTEQHEREALIRKVVESCPAPILMNRPGSGEILFKSPGIDELFGPVTNAREFYVNLPDRDDFLSELYVRGVLYDWRARYHNAQGEKIWVAISARLIQWEGEDVIVSHARDLSGELEIEAELNRQREQIFQNEKMSALGGLLAGVAHELNNPLSVVVGHAMMLQDEALDPDVHRQVGKISDAAERCAKIVKTFLTMARQEPVKMAETDINDVVATAVEVARFGEGSRGVRIDTDLDTGLTPVCADADQITQVLLNLILNAEQAIADAGTGSRIGIRTKRDPSDGVRVLIEDDGPGVPADIRARIFEPFFTTKEPGQGTGVGLAVCHRIVAAHNGRLNLETAADGTGARFVVTLPSGRPAGAAVHDEAADAPVAGAARVLVIDDEADVADLSAEVLERGGYQTSVAYRAEDAFEMLRNGHFDAVVSDLNMPGIDGRGFFEVIRAEFSDLLPRTGFLTGDTMGQASQRFLKDAERPYLEKPASPRELRAFVARLAGGAEG